jgi:hypothetical protein
MTFQIDGGANCGAVTSMDPFYFYVKSEMSVQQVNGSSFSTPGWGGILVRIDGCIRMLAPFHFCPSNPRNTFSPSSLREYCAFDQTIISTNDSMLLVTDSGQHLRQSLSIYNDLDFIQLEVMSFNHSSVQQAYHSHLIDSSRTLNSKSLPTQPLSKSPQNDSPTSSPLFPRRVLNLIAMYYVQLFEPSSPQENAIRTMNSLLGHRFRNLSSPSPCRPPQSVSTSYQSSSSKSTNPVLLPVINKLSRLSQQGYTPIQQYMHLHLSFMHASDHTLTPILKNQLLRDLPKTLHSKLPSMACTCSICALRKADKLPCGRLTDHTKLSPFRLLHIDFSFFGTTSLRGFTSALDITCGSTSYPIGFPTKAKTPPLDIVRWVISTF